MIMTTLDLLKLAPELSAEERYKLMTADFMARANGEQSLITESERRAMLRFPTTTMWREYATSVVTFKLVNTIWIHEIDAEKLRTYACYLLSIHELERIIVDAEDKLPNDRQAKQFDNLKSYVAAFNRAIKEFRVYREAIPKLEQELCGIPFFSKPTKAFIATSYELIDQVAAFYNDTVRKFCDDKRARKFMKPIVHDINSYLVKEGTPDLSGAATLVEQIKELAEAEMRSRE